MMDISTHINNARNTCQLCFSLQSRSTQQRSPHRNQSRRQSCCRPTRSVNCPRNCWTVASICLVGTFPLSPLSSAPQLDPVPGFPFSPTHNSRLSLTNLTNSEKRPKPKPKFAYKLKLKLEIGITTDRGGNAWPVRQFGCLGKRSCNTETPKRSRVVALARIRNSIQLVHTLFRTLTTTRTTRQAKRKSN